LNGNRLRPIRFAETERPGRFSATQIEKELVMPMVAEKEMEHIGETQGMENHDHDLVQDLNRRLDALWRYDQYIANADGHPELQRMWRDFKQQEQENVKRLKQCIAKEVEEECF
jgi:hypothetical protein